MTTSDAEFANAIATALAGQYDIQGELGGGGMSHVYLATERSLDRTVVIKVLSAERTGDMAVDRFAREIQLLATLQQANIVPLLAAGEVLGLPYYTMPFVEGASLRHRLTRDGRIPALEVIDIARDVSRALSYAHAKGVVHRDIKPDNILQSHGTAVVTDFGIAKALAASRNPGTHPTLTQYGAAIGTPSYMAPEQTLADPDLGPPADLYAFGCVLYELLSGRRPFERDDARQMLSAHLFDPPDAPLLQVAPETPPRLAALVERCLEKDPKDRPASADALLESLSAVISDSHIGAPIERPEAIPGNPVMTTAPSVARLSARAAPREEVPEHAVPAGRPRRPWTRATLVAAMALVIMVGWGAYRERQERTRTRETQAQARLLVGERTSGGLAKAIQTLRDGVARDSTSAAAWGLLSQALTLQALYSNVPTPPALAAADDAVRRALAIDADESVARATQAYLLFLRDWQPLGADSAFRALYARQPRNVLAQKWHGDVLDALGRHGEAWRSLEASRLADSSAGAAQANLARELLLSGDTAGAIAAFERSLAQNPMHPLALRDLTRLVFARGDSARFFSLHDRHLLVSDRSGAPTATLRRAWQSGGPGAVVAAQVDAFGRANLPYERAYWRSLSGDVAGTIRDLNDAVAAHDAWVPFLGRFPSARVRQTPAFQALLDRVHLPRDVR